MKIFFDLGYHHGQGLRQATNALGINREEWRVYCVEPNPTNYNRMTQERHIFGINAAAWDKNEILTLSVETGWKGDPDGWGSSVVPEWEHGKVSKKPWGEVSVCGFDTVEMIKMRSEPEDEVYIKMDIEGAEYRVIRHMLTQGDEFWDRIKFFDVEFHHRFITNESVISTDDLLCGLRRRCKNVTIHS